MNTDLELTAKLISRKPILYSFGLLHQYEIGLKLISAKKPRNNFQRTQELSRLYTYHKMEYHLFLYERILTIKRINVHIYPYQILDSQWYIFPYQILDNQWYTNLKTQISNFQYNSNI